MENIVFDINFCCSYNVDFEEIVFKNILFYSIKSFIEIILLRDMKSNRIKKVLKRDRSTS